MPGPQGWSWVAVRNKLGLVDQEAGAGSLLVALTGGARVRRRLRLGRKPIGLVSMALVSLGAIPWLPLPAYPVLLALVACCLLKARPPAPIVVAGDDSFASAVAAAAGDRRRVATIASTMDDRDRLVSLVANLSRTEELFIDTRLFERVQPLATGSVLPRGGIRLLAPDEIGPQAFRPALPLLARSLKRALDVSVAAAGLVLLAPVMLGAAVAIRLDSTGPVLFRQARLGADGRSFNIYKLRTMLTGTDDAAHRAYVASLIQGRAERQDSLFKLIDDPRITRVGRHLRRSSVDELPQLWNVLRGQMSLVGPRPALPHEVDLYDAGTWQRMRVKPGLTGLWQVSGRSQLSFQEMVALDIRYWRDWSPGLEAVILLRTPRTVLCGAGTA